MSEHPTRIEGFETFKSLATTIGNLRYDALCEFLHCLADKFDEDSRTDQDRGRPYLSRALFEARNHIDNAVIAVEHAQKLKPKKEV
jgi:hypothetical protein